MSLLGFFTLYTLHRNIPALVALIVASLPALSYIRVFFFYNSVLFMLGLGLVFWFAHSHKECARLWKNQLIRWFFIAGMLYWVLSVLLTGHYHANIRVLEMLCSAGSIYLLAFYPKYLASALGGLSISIIAVVIGVFGLGDRLGMASINGAMVGNAISFGLPVALVLILAAADSGKWLLLQKSGIIKNVLIAMCATFLLLSTSRGSWLVAIVGIGVAVFYQSQQRRKIFVAILLMGCVLVGVLQTKGGERVSEWFEKLTDSERTLSQKTTGRFEQWLLFSEVLEDSPIWGVGPGHGKKAFGTYAAVNRDVTVGHGKELAWHALYMQVGVETGMIGLIVLAIFLGRLIVKTIIYRRLTGQVVPLIGILGFMTIGISVPGLDSISGLFLGLAFLGTISSSRKVRDKAQQLP